MPLQSAAVHLQTTPSGAHRQEPPDIGISELSSNHRTAGIRIPASDVCNNNTSRQESAATTTTSVNQNASASSLQGAFFSRFTFNDLTSITNHFDAKPRTEGGRLLGVGAFGSVFLGLLANSECVAVKKLNVDPVVMKQFKTEVNVLSQ